MSAAARAADAAIAVLVTIAAVMAVIVQARTNSGPYGGSVRPKKDFDLDLFQSVRAW
ncbi:MAG: hypothetical protein ACRDOB_16585 [Streptosporangiaceae bacterium]